MVAPVGPQQRHALAAVFVEFACLPDLFALLVRERGSEWGPDARRPYDRGLDDRDPEDPPPDAWEDFFRERPPNVDHIHDDPFDYLWSGEPDLARALCEEAWALVQRLRLVVRRRFSRAALRTRPNRSGDNAGDTDVGRSRHPPGNTPAAGGTPVCRGRRCADRTRAASCRTRVGTGRLPGGSLPARPACGRDHAPDRVCADRRRRGAYGAGTGWRRSAKRSCSRSGSPTPARSRRGTVSISPTR